MDLPWPAGEFADEESGRRHPRACHYSEGSGLVWRPLRAAPDIPPYSIHVRSEALE